MTMTMTMTRRGTIVISDGKDTIELWAPPADGAGGAKYQGSGTTVPVPPAPPITPQPRPKHPRPPPEEEPEIETLPAPPIGPVVTVIKPIGDDLGADSLLRDFSAGRFTHLQIDCRGFQELQSRRIAQRLLPSIALLEPGRRPGWVALDMNLTWNQWRNGFEVKTFSALLDNPDLRLGCIRLLLQDDELEL